jgi:probable O-glycosylation ligase (exosortase A-associated)
MKGLIFTYAMTYGGAVLALVNPYYGFLIYVCFGIVRPEAMWPWSVPAGNYSRTIAFALIASWLIHGLGNWNFGRARGIVGAMLVFWACNGISLMFAPDWNAAWWFFDVLSKILLPLFIGCTLIDSQAKVRQLLWVIALSQGFVAYEMNLSYFAGVNRLMRDGFGSLDNNVAAVTMVAAAGLAFMLALHEEKLWRRGLAAVICLLSVHAVMFSFSRGALLSLVMMGGFAFVLIPKRPLFVGAFVVATVIGVQLAGPEVLERFATVFVDKEERDESAESRLDLWKACMREMIANPITGIGLDHWKKRAHYHGFVEGKAAHSLWMQTGAETGVLGLGSLVAFYGLTMWRLWPVARGQLPLGADPYAIVVAQSVMCALSGCLVASQFVSSNLVEIPFYIAGAGIGTLRVLSLQEAEAYQQAWEDEECAEAHAGFELHPAAQ